MNSHKKNICLIGCGSIGSAHCQSIFQYSKKSQLHSVFDLNTRLAERISKKYGVEVKYNINDVKEDPDIDIVLICVPNDYHKSVSEEMAESKKHIMLEVPIANTISDAKEIIQICDKNEVKLTLNYSKRYLPHISRAKEIFESGTIGDVISTSIEFLDYRNEGYWQGASWRGDTDKGGGGVLILHARHSIDYIHDIVSKRISSVSGFSTHKYPNLPIEDSISLSYVYEGGAIGTINASFSHIGQPRIMERITGTEGMILLDMTKGNGSFFSKKKNNFGKAGNLNSLLSSVPLVNTVSKWSDDFVDCIEENKEPLVTGIQAYDNILFITSAYNSVKQKSVLELNYDY